MAVDLAGESLDDARERRRLYEQGKRSADAHVAVLRHELNRWRREAQWWHEEHDRVHKEYCEFVTEMAQRLPK